jgi:hypothetical protein
MQEYTITIQNEEYPIRNNHLVFFYYDNPKQLENVVFGAGFEKIEVNQDLTVEETSNWVRDKYQEVLFRDTNPCLLIFDGTNTVLTEEMLDKIFEYSTYSNYDLLIRHDELSMKSNDYPPLSLKL